MKAYQFNEKTDYIFYLAEIISDTYKYKTRLKRYLLEIEQMLNENQSAETVETILYEAISDKTKAVLYYLFNLLGDESNCAISFRRFRKLLIKNSKNLNIELKQLTNDEAKASNHFNTHRNWGLHIPESLLTNKRQILKINKVFIEENYSQKITVPHFEYFEIKYLIKLKEEVKDVIENIEILERRMYLDYSILVENEFSFELDTIQVKPYLLMDIVKGSMKTQQGKRN